MKILFVSGTGRQLRPFYDPSTRYRCFNPASELAKRGHRALVIAQSALEEQPAQFGNFDAYIFHRPFYSSTLARIVLGWKKERPVIADYDDLLFDPGLFNIEPTARKEMARQHETIVKLNKIAAAASLFDRFSVSTRPLREALQKSLNPQQIEIIHNGATDHWQNMASLERRKRPFHKRKYLFGYFPGTATHEMDLLSIWPIVLKHLEAHNGEMLIQGQIDMKGFPGWPNRRVTFAPITTPYNYAANLAKCKYCLAPLETSPFTEAKSAVKFIEAATAGSVTIATPIEDMDRFKSPLLRKCRTTDEWSSTLQNLSSLPQNHEEELKKLAPSIGMVAPVDMLLKLLLKT